MQRVENFSDGFFAIVITLLVLNLRLPEHPADAPRLLGELWPVFAAYGVSFVNIYILWVSHHELTRLTSRVDTNFLYLNGAMLLGVGLMPFATSFLADFLIGDNARTAATVYTGVFVWIAVFFNLLWRYLAAKPERLIETVSRSDRLRIGRTQLVTLLLFILAFAIAWALPWVGVGVTLALALFFAIADRLSGFASEDIAEAQN